MTTHRPPSDARRFLPLRLPLLLVLLGPGGVLTPPATRAADPQAAAPPEATAAAQQFAQQVAPFVARHCAACHSGDKPKGELRLDQLRSGLEEQDAAAAGKVLKRWLAALEQVEAGAMPPKERPRPTAAEIKPFGQWIRAREAALDEQRRGGGGRVVLRRLNRVEYENTVRDLLGIDAELRELLPADTSSHGFDNVGEAMHVSSFLMERYLETADTALSYAISNGPQPPLIKKRYQLKEDRRLKASEESVYRFTDDAVVLFSSSAWNAVHLYDFYPPDRGRYRFRLAVQAIQSGGKPATFRVDAGAMGMVGKNHLVSYYDALADAPRMIEFVDDLEARSTIRISPYGLAGANTVHKIGADKYDGKGLAIQWVEVEGPLHDRWPPESHRRLFGDLPQELVEPKDWRKRVEVTSKSPAADADRVLRRFARRAFRRSVTDADIKPFTELVQRKLGEGRSFEKALRAGLKAILVAPEFLFLRESPGPLDDFALASRLSYFLWSTMPDEELLKQCSHLAPRDESGRQSGRHAENKEPAAKGKSADGTGREPAIEVAATLRDPAMLRQQVERMLAHPKAAAFTNNFVSQWLGLRDLDFTLPSHILYPEYDDMLRESMQRETELFFAQVLKVDLSLTNFAASDFAMLNGRLARHYGIPGPEGWEFRKVQLPPGSHRGGVLTMASVLKVTANGTSTSPVIRGAWVLDRILGTPPPKPPADVPAVEPDIRGATTIREQLAKHRQVASCATCHVRIDPPGFALESFDVIGGWRDHYRTTGNGKEVKVDGRRMPYLQGKPIDPSDVLADGRRFRDIDEFKQLLLADKDQLARSLTEKLVTYATGAPVTAADKPQVEAIIGKIRAKNYGLRTLVHEIVQSELFRRK